MPRAKISKRQEKHWAFNATRKRLGYGKGWIAHSVRALINNGGVRRPDLPIKRHHERHPILDDEYPVWLW